MKYIPTGGISDLKPLEGTDNIYLGMDIPHGDLYEAEELCRDGGHVIPGRLVFVKYPYGEVMEPVKARPGQYFGDPIFYDGSVYIPLADFPAGEIRILRLDGELKEVQLHAAVPLSEIEDCYNLMLKTAPLMLTRQAGSTLEIVWPEKRTVELSEREVFRFREDDKLWTSRWCEEGEGDTYRYWDETVVRDLEGNELFCLCGDTRIMPNGEKWFIG